MLLQLKILNGERQGEILSLEKFPVCFGRGEEADFYLSIEDMSRKHFMILEEKKEFFIMDCHSTNGTYLNEKKLSQKTSINHLDYIQAGSLLCQVLMATCRKENPVLEKINIEDGQTPVYEDPADSKIRRKIPQNILEKIYSKSVSTNYNALKILYEILQECNTESDYEILLNKLLDKIFPILKAERGAIVLNYKNLKIEIFTTLKGKSKPFPLSKTILWDVMENGVCICSDNLLEDVRYQSAESLRIQKVESLLCVPIVSSEEILGAIYFDRCSKNSPTFKNEDLDLLAAIGIVSGNTLQKLLLFQKIQKINSHLMTILENFSGGKNKLGMQEMYDWQSSEMESALYSIAQGISTATGEDFLKLASNFFIKNLEVEYVHIGILDESKKNIQTKIVQQNQNFLENFEYPLEEGPCFRALREQKILYDPCYHQNSTCSCFPFKEDFQSYMGGPFFRLDGVPLGMIVLLSRKPFENKMRAELMIQIFAFRIAAELERKISELSMKNLNKSLQKRAEELFLSQKMLEKQSKNLQTILDSIGDGVVVISNHCDFLLCNPAAENMLEINRAEKLSERWLEKSRFFLPDKKTPFPFRQFPLIIAIHGESVKKIEAFYKPENHLQTGIWFSINARPIKDAENSIRGAVAIFSDITEKKHQEESLREMQVELERKVQERTAALLESNECLKQEIMEKNNAQDALSKSNQSLEEALSKLQETQEKLIHEERLRALGEMASGIVHDFNNALGPITGFSELLLNRPENLANADKVKKYLELIHISSKDACRVVERLSNFYRKREKSENLISIDMNGLIKQTVSLTEPKWKEQPRAQGITIEIEMNLQNIPTVRGNEADLRESLTNLIFNAVDAMEKDGKITISTEYQAPFVVIRVADTGKGMPKEVKQRCLEPFYTTKGKNGTGLGLSMVFGIIQRHEGKLNIESEERQGTCIIIHLPTGTEKTAEKMEDKHVSLSIPSLNVLVAEDDPNVREVVGMYLKDEGHNVVLTCDGIEAVEKFSTDKFDLVITDQAMPKMSGDQVAKKIKYLSPDIPVVLLTGFSSFLSSENISSYGIDMIINKPLNRSKLHNALNSLFSPKQIS